MPLGGTRACCVPPLRFGVPCRRREEPSTAGDRSSYPWGGGRTSAKGGCYPRCPAFALVSSCVRELTQSLVAVVHPVSSSGCGNVPAAHFRDVRAMSLAPSGGRAQDVPVTPLIGLATSPGKRRATENSITLVTTWFRNDDPRHSPAGGWAHLGCETLSLRAQCALQSSSAAGVGAGTLLAAGLRRLRTDPLGVHFAPGRKPCFLGLATSWHPLGARGRTAAGAGPCARLPGLWRCVPGSASPTSGGARGRP